MKLLALETATHACSCALLMGEEVAASHVVAPRQHASLLLGMVEERLQQAGLRLGELDALAFGRGPGAFTGVRVAAGVVQGLALGAGLGVVAVSTLQALAAGAVGEAVEGRVLAAMDARMGEIYAGAYAVDASGRLRGVGDEQVCVPAELRAPPDGNWLGVGDGFRSYAQPLRMLLDERLVGTLPERLPHAADVARLAASDARAGRLLAPEEAVPVYLRDRVAVPPGRG